MAIWITLLALVVAACGQSLEDTDCQHTLLAELDEEPQTIQSPNYPSNYPNLISCKWRILTSTPNTQVELETGTILTERCCDVLEIRDGSSEAAPLVASFRGNTSARNIISTFGALFITFVSDESLTEQGFQFQFQAADIERCGSDDLMANRGFQVLASPGYLSSPPSPYPRDTYCVWTITAPVGQYVNLRLNAINTERCCSDIQIRDGDGKSQNDKFFGSLTGTLNSRIRLLFTSSNRSLSIRFRSKRSSTRGFTATYRSVSTPREDSTVPPSEESCSGTLQVPTEGHGNFSSPHFPDVHGENLMCSWTLRAPSGSRVHVWFSYVNTESCCDWIKIRDGPYANSSKLGVLSGLHSSFHSFVSTSDVIRVDFDTDATINRRGFTAFYEIYRPSGVPATTADQCGGKAEAFSFLQYITSPNWPEDYPPNIACAWVISTATSDARVKIHFLGLLLETIFDSIRIHDGSSTSSPLVRIYTGRFYAQHTYTSTGPFLTLEFRSDRSVTHGGFRASYTEVLP